MVPKLLLSYKLLVKRNHNNHLGQLLIRLYQEVVRLYSNTFLRIVGFSTNSWSALSSTNGVKKAHGDIVSTVPSRIRQIKSKLCLDCCYPSSPQSCLTQTNHHQFLRLFLSRYLVFNTFAILVALF